MSRSLQEIVYTGAYSSEESQRLKAAGYEWRQCSWCKVRSYTREGLCSRCAQDRSTGG